MLGVYF
nr:ubiquitin-conjugating enzyme E2 [Capsicum annuum]